MCRAPVMGAGAVVVRQSQPFGYQHDADVFAIHGEMGERAAEIADAVTGDGYALAGDDLLKLGFGALAKGALGRAMRMEYLGGVDALEADVLLAKCHGVAVDHANGASRDHGYAGDGHPDLDDGDGGEEHGFHRRLFPVKHCGGSLTLCRTMSRKSMAIGCGTGAFPAS